MKYLILLVIALSFAGCDKQELNKCQTDLAEQEKINSVLVSKVGEKCPECVECLPCDSEDCIKVPQMSSDEVCEYYKSLYSNLTHVLYQQLKECRKQ